jgi:hypothetical protein
MESSSMDSKGIVGWTDPSKFYKVRIGYEDVFEAPASLDSIKNILSSLPLRVVLEIVTRIGAFLLWKRFDLHNTQDFLVQRVFSPEDIKKVNRYINANPQIRPALIFSIQQLRLLAKCALWYSADVPSSDFSWSPEVCRSFSMAFLMVNDLIGKSSPAEPVDDQYFCGLAIRSTYANDTDVFPYALARYWDLFIDYPSTRSTRSAPLNLEQKFKDITGVGLLDYLSVGLALTVSLISVDENTFDSRRVTVNPRTHFMNSKLGAETISLVCDLTSMRVEEAKRLAGEYHSCAPFDHDCLFAQRLPMVRLSDGVLVPFSADTMIEKITGGLYWIFMNGLNSKDKKHFMGYLGCLFEDYIFERILFPRCGRDLCVRGKYRKGKEEKEATDIIVLDPPHIFFIECKTARLRYETKSTGNMLSFEEDLQDGYLKALRQLDHAVKIFRRGDIDQLIGIPQETFSRVWPVVLFLDRYPQDPFLTNYYSKKKNEVGVLQRPDVALPCLMSVDDLELCEVLMQSGKTFRSLIRERMQNSEHLQSPFRNFLLSTYPEVSMPSNLRLKTYYDDLMKKIAKNVFEHLDR